jgi:hypothetical protein
VARAGIFLPFECHLSIFKLDVRQIVAMRRVHRAMRMRTSTARGAAPNAGQLCNPRFHRANQRAPYFARRT